MKDDRVTLVCWAGDPPKKIRMMEELLVQFQLSGKLQPLLLEAGQELPLHRLPWESAHPNDAAHRLFKSCILRSVPWQTIPAFVATLNNAVKRKAQKTFADFHFFVVGDDSFHEAYAGTVERAICLIQPDAASSSFIYDFVKRSLDSGRIAPTIAAIFTDVPQIEDAAAAFRKLESDLKKLLPKNEILKFGGILEPKAEYWEMARSFPRYPLTDLFKGNGFQGQLKYAVSACLASLPFPRVFNLEATIGTLTSLTYPRTQPR